MIDKQLFIKEANEVLILGNTFAEALNNLQEKYTPVVDELDQLAMDGDKELLALMDKFEELEDLIDL